MAFIGSSSYAAQGILSLSTAMRSLLPNRRHRVFVPFRLHRIERSKYPLAPLPRLRATRHTMSLPAPRLDCARLALLRPGDSLEQLQAALGASWSPPRPKDDGWWRPSRHLDGFKARIGADSRLVSVCFYGNFSRRCVVEELRIHMPLASALARQPSLRKLESISGPRRDVRHMRCHQGYHLFVHIYQRRI